MNEIIVKQNKLEFIELLKAQRIAYEKCKRLQILDVISILIAILFPLLAYKFPVCQNIINAFGVLWTILYLVTEYHRKNMTAQGAVIQEQFDTELYAMKWNNVLCKDRVNIDTIQELASHYKKQDLENWYSPKISINHPVEIAVLLCQRINFSWEITQRKKFVTLLGFTAAIYYFIYLAMGFNNIGFFDLLVMMSPSISFLVYCVLNIITLNGHIKSKNSTLNIIDRELDKYKNARTVPSAELLRQIQDVIFMERTVPEKIPDWFYRFNKSRNENFIDNLIIKIQNNI